MRVIKAGARELYLGKVGESMATQVRFPFVAEWQTTYGDGGTFEIRTRRPGEGQAWVVLESRVEGGSVLWDVTATDVAIAGSGECELSYSVGGVRAISKTWRTTVAASLYDEQGDPPAPWQSWVDRVVEAGNTATQKAAEASGSAEDAGRDALKAEGLAVGQQNGEDVEQGSPYYHNNAAFYAGIASDAADSAAEDAERAEQGAVNAGYMFFEINDAGHVIYRRTSNTETDFEIRNGRLILYAAD